MALDMFAPLAVHALAAKDEEVVTGGVFSRRPAHIEAAPEISGAESL